MCIETTIWKLAGACWGHLKTSESLPQSASFFPPPVIICLLENCGCLKRLLKEWLLNETFCLKRFFLTATKPSVAFGLGCDWSIAWYFSKEVKQMLKTSYCLGCNWTDKKKSQSCWMWPQVLGQTYTKCKLWGGWCSLSAHRSLSCSSFLTVCFINYLNT